MKFKFLYICLFLMYINTYSQIDPPPDEDENEIPIDSFISILVVSGVAYCLTKVKSKN